MCPLLLSNASCIPYANILLSNKNCQAFNSPNTLMLGIYRNVHGWPLLQPPGIEPATSQVSPIYGVSHLLNNYLLSS